MLNQVYPNQHETAHFHLDDYHFEHAKCRSKIVTFKTFLVREERQKCKKVTKHKVLGNIMETNMKDAR